MGLTASPEGPEAATSAARFHLGHGTTSLLASLASAPLDELAEQTVGLRPLVEAGVRRDCTSKGHSSTSVVAGPTTPNFDGPRCRVAAGSRRQRRQDGHPRPELAGGLDAIRAITDVGVVAALATPDATYEQAVEAIDAGVRVATHCSTECAHLTIVNPVQCWRWCATLESPLSSSAMAFHLHEALLESIFAAVGPSRVVLITDAISATGCRWPARTCRFGSAGDRRCRRIGRRFLARRKHPHHGCRCEKCRRRRVSFTDAIAAATSNPARTLGFDDRGSLGWPHAPISSHSTPICKLPPSCRLAIW